METAPARVLFTEKGEAWIRQTLAVVRAPALLFHAALVRLGDRGIVCCGSPGAGKSTLARLLPGEALGEELALVDPRRDEFEAEVIPVRGEGGGSACVAAVVELVHGDQHALAPLGASEAVRVLARHVYWPVDDPVALRGAFGTLVRLAERVPVARLSFRPTRDVRRVLAEAVP